MLLKGNIKSLHEEQRYSLLLIISAEGKDHFRWNRCKHAVHCAWRLLSDNGLEHPLLQQIPSGINKKRNI